LPSVTVERSINKVLQPNLPQFILGSDKDNSEKVGLKEAGGGISSVVIGDKRSRPDLRVISKGGDIGVVFGFKFGGGFNINGTSKSGSEAGIESIKDRRKIRKRVRRGWRKSGSRKAISNFIGKSKGGIS